MTENRSNPLNSGDREIRDESANPSSSSVVTGEVVSPDAGAGATSVTDSRSLPDSSTRAATNSTAAAEGLPPSTPDLNLKNMRRLGSSTIWQRTRRRMLRPTSWMKVAYVVGGILSAPFACGWVVDGVRSATTLRIVAGTAEHTPINRDRNVDLVLGVDIERMGSDDAISLYNQFKDGEISNKIEGNFINDFGRALEDVTSANKDQFLERAVFRIAPGVDASIPTPQAVATMQAADSNSRNGAQYLNNLRARYTQYLNEVGDARGDDRIRMLLFRFTESYREVADANPADETAQRAVYTACNIAKVFAEQRQLSGVALSPKCD